MHFENICIDNNIKINNIIKEKENIIKEKNKLIDILENSLKDANNSIEKLKNEKHNLEELNNIYKTDHECLKEIAKQPKNVNTTNNNNSKILTLISPFNINDKDKIRNIVNDNYNVNYIFSGQKGCAKFAFEI